MIRANEAGAGTPTLRGRLGEHFDRWLAGAAARYEPPLSTSQVGRGIRALSTLYVERRNEVDLTLRARDGLAKRAALASYFAPLHFLTTWHGLQEQGARLEQVSRILDLGCGTGATGAAAALACEGRPPLLGVDVSGWALSEARHTFRAFRLRGRTLRRRLPEGLPQLRPGDLVVLGWALNELAGPAREQLLAQLEKQAPRVGVLFIEPLATRVAPWWPEASRRFDPDGAGTRLLRLRRERPDRVAALDAASGLDHRVLGARLCLVPPQPTQGSEFRIDT
ncbi:MAG: methyltransferase domain-containing protein [Myxococcota bacterium]